MAFETGWAVEQRVFFCMIVDEITLSDFRMLDYLLGAEVKTSGVAPVFVVVDLTGLKRYPDLSEMTGFKREKIDSIFWTVLIVEDPIVRFIGAVVTRVTGSPLQVTRTRAEAEQFIRSRASGDLPPFDWDRRT